MINVIEGGLAIIGCIVIVFLVIALTQEAIDRCRNLSLQWKFHSDSANENRDKIRKLEREVGELESSQIDLRHHYNRLATMIEAQPKKAKSK